VLTDALGIPVFFSETGAFTGTISGIETGDGDSQGGQQ
jgi:hypothetical protein